MFKVPSLPRSYEAARRDLGDRAASVRASAARDLAAYADQRRAEVVATLIDALDDADATVRAAAAVALADLEAHEAIDALVAHADKDDLHVRQMALTALGEIGDDRAAPAVKRAMKDPRPEIRFQATIAWARVSPSHDAAVEELLRASRDEDPLVAHIALRMAEELGRPDDEEGAVDARVVARAKVMKSHDSERVAVIAAIILAREGIAEGQELLVRAAIGEADTDDAEDVAAAIELCGELGLVQATAGLERRAFGGRFRLSGDPFTWHARTALARMKNPRATQAILGDLTSWDRHKRTLAVAAAARAELLDALPLVEAMRDKPERADASAVDDAIRRLHAARDAHLPD